jgi:hypothetical protein
MINNTNYNSQGLVSALPVFATRCTGICMEEIYPPNGKKQK